MLLSRRVTGGAVPTPNSHTNVNVSRCRFALPRHCPSINLSSTIVIV